MSQPYTDDELRAHARADWARYVDGIEIDSDAEISLNEGAGTDDGAFVAAWIWVSYAEVEEAKERARAVAEAKVDG